MREKCCKNCLFFIDNSKPETYPSANCWDIQYVCHFHGSEVSINWPEDQFCGDEHWISVKVKTRIDNLEKLGI
jgi:hypothetical protein